MGTSKRLHFDTVVYACSVRMVLRNTQQHNIWRRGLRTTMATEEGRAQQLQLLDLRWVCLRRNPSSNFLENLQYPGRDGAQHLKRICSLPVYHVSLSSVNCRSIPLHCLGLEGQQIFDTLDLVSRSYDHAVAALHSHFGKEGNVMSERYRFRHNKKESQSSNLFWHLDS